MGKGNGAHKISSIWLDHEISDDKAVKGDMIIFKDTGQWDRIDTIYVSMMKWSRDFKTKFGKMVSADDVIVVRY